MKTNIYYNGDLLFDTKKALKNIEISINNNSINVIILTEPLFGSGSSVDENIYLKLGDICKSKNIFLIIDNTYGGMNWNDTIYPTNKFFFNLTKENKNIFVIESVCKRLFFNGIKNGIIIADEHIVKQLEHISVYISGSMTYQQIEIYKKLYNYKNHDLLLNQITNNIKYFRSNYELIDTSLKGTTFKLVHCDSGYFCLIGIPIKSKHLTNTEIASKIISDVNILTIPHDRYLLLADDFYYFRVNLSMQTNILLDGINILLQSYFNGI